MVGASAGGIEALTTMVHALPAPVNAALFVSVHFPAHSESKLPAILTRAGHLLATHAEDGESIQRGHIYVAPPDYHLLLQDGKIRLDHGPRQNGFRPSIDVLFRSAARCYGSRVMGILLSGMLDDGVIGLQEIHTRGGMAIAQDPEEAAFDILPLAAIQAGAVDQILSVNKIAAVIHQDSKLAPKIESGVLMTELSDPETGKIEGDIERFEGDGRNDTVSSVLTCPECGGVLWETNDGEISRYQCHVGHMYSAESMLEEQARAIESALWTALRSLRERAFFLRRLANLSGQHGSEKLKRRYVEQAEDLEKSADLLRRSFLDGRYRAQSGSQVNTPPGA